MNEIIVNEMENIFIDYFFLGFIYFLFDFFFLRLFTLEEFGENFSANGNWRKT